MTTAHDEPARVLPTEPVLPAEVDVVVVGAGLMGASAAWAAARRGLSVVLLEQFDIGHAHGSSHGSARIVRRAYADPLYAGMTGLAFESWRELELDTGASLLRLTGGLDHGRGRAVPQIAAALSEVGVPYELLPAEEAERRWPGMRFSGDVIFHAQAGTVDAAATVAAASSRARELGAVLAPHTRLLRLRVEGGGEVTVQTDRGDVRASRVIVAAGAWVVDLLRDVLASASVALPPLAVTQQQIFHFARRAGVPEWPIAIQKDVLDIYSLPGGADGGPAGARKVAEHLADVTSSHPVTPSTRSGVVDDRARTRIVEYVERWLPGLVPEPFAEATCLYTTTPDEDFVLDRVGPVVVCSPCSGHGAKFAPLIGELTVDLASGVSTTPDGTLDPARARLLAQPRFTLGGHRAGTRVTASTAGVEGR
ncbi:FAD-dependent oxidoreductase [uncultured Friedmanniella sp.]|uniref:FAD-dependent oxidoreductase n=1 Tax=uncultured Friedmanniella sp. TaxID=335381 RepID=UPI0035CBE13B